MKHLFINGKIFTSDAKHPYADAMVVQDRKILWTGEQDAMPAAWKEEIASVTDLEGRRVIPGFVDAHMHPVMLADFRKKITIMPPETAEEHIENLLELGQVLISQGITSICDMGNLDTGDNIPLYEAAAQKASIRG